MSVRQESRIKHIIGRCMPPILLDVARAVLRPGRPPLDELNHAGIKEIECQGLRWRLDMASLISRDMVTTGIWEPVTTRLVLDFVKRGMHVLSIGANFGYYALLMAREVGPSGHVWAFEPTQRYSEQLRWNIDLNGFSDRITIVPFGLSDSTKTATIEISPESASLHFPPSIIRVRNEVIELRRLDDVIMDLGIGTIGFISMDIADWPMTTMTVIHRSPTLNDWKTTTDRSLIGKLSYGPAWANGIVIIERLTP
jgi:FkbM family methyltransferase